MADNASNRRDKDPKEPEPTIKKVREGFDLFQSLVNGIALFAGLAGFAGLRNRLQGGTQNPEEGSHENTTAAGSDKMEEQVYLFLSTLGKPPKETGPLIDYQLDAPTRTELAVFTSFLKDILSPDQAHVVWNAINRKDSTVRIPVVQKFETFNPKAGKDVTMRQLHELAITINVKGGVIIKEFARFILGKTEAGADPTPEEQKARMEYLRDVMVHSQGLPPRMSKTQEAKEMAMETAKKAETGILNFGSRLLIGTKAHRELSQDAYLTGLDLRIKNEKDHGKKMALEEERQVHIAEKSTRWWDRMKFRWNLTRWTIVLSLAFSAYWVFNNILNTLNRLS